jgi:hypothetical protein
MSAEVLSNDGVTLCMLNSTGSHSGVPVLSTDVVYSAVSNVPVLGTYKLEN